MDPAITRVLVVDDNPGDARLVEYALSHESEGNFRCERVVRIAAALERLQQDDIDVVLLDFGLPDSQGTEGLRRIRERAPRVSVVMLTGSTNPIMIRSALSAGAQDYLVKGIFPKGYLAWVIRIAIQFRKVEIDLLEDRPLDPRPISELSESGIGVGVFGPSGPTIVNEALSELMGTPDTNPEGLPPWLKEIVGEPLGPSARGSGGPVRREAIHLDIGEIAVKHATGEPVALEYVVRRFPALEIPRVLVFLREISRERRSPRRRLGPAPPEVTLVPGVAPTPPGQRGTLAKPVRSRWIAPLGRTSGSSREPTMPSSPRSSTPSSAKVAGWWGAYNRRWTIPTPRASVGSPTR